MARWWTAALLTLLARDARAEAPAEPTARVTYTAPSECPDVTAFKAQVQRRTPRYHDGVPGSATLLLDISLQLSGSVATGRLEVTDGHGQRSLRTISGPSCIDVAQALALMAALAIDPLAATRGPDAPPPPALPSPPPVVAPPVLAPTEAPAPLATARPPVLAPASDEPRRRAASWHLSFGFGLSSSWGVVPEAVAGEQLFVEVSSPFRATWGLRLRAGVERGSIGIVPLNGGAASFRWTVGTLDGCPLEWRLGGLSVLACVRVEAGQLDGVGAEVIPVGEAPRAWLSLAAPARLRWTPLLPLSFEAFGGPRVPITRDQFRFAPDIPAYRAPAGGALLGLDMLVTFL